VLNVKSTNKNEKLIPAKAKARGHLIVLFTKRNGTELYTAAAAQKKYSSTIHS